MCFENIFILMISNAWFDSQNIFVSVLANNESEKDLGVIKASLIQTTKFIASDEEKTKDYVLRTVTGTSLLKVWSYSPCHCRFVFIRAFLQTHVP